MRIFDAIRKPGALMRIGNDLVSVDAKRKLLVESAVRVVADECSRWYWESERNYWDLSEHFGPLRLPFDTMWIEWSVPERVRIEGEWGERQPVQVAVQAMAMQPSEAWAGSRKDSQAIALSMFVKDPHRETAAMIQGTELVLVDKDGNYVDSRVLAASATLGEAAIAEMMEASLRPAWLAISLMNCRNVQVQQTVVPPKKVKRDQRKRGWSGLSYHTITLPAPARPRNQSEARAAAGGATPLHLVRGHFKTYTSEKPLFGSRTGTYWWNWHARGAADNGVVVKDYAVAP